MRDTLRRMQRREKDSRRYKKITAILMLGLGHSAQATADALGIDDATVYRYADKYTSAPNIEGYLRDEYTAYEGKLSPEQLAELEAELKSRLYTSANDICAFIASRFGAKYTPTGLVPLLHRLNFEYKKTRQVTPNADPEAQREAAEAIAELVETAPEGDSIYFCDAVHPQHNTRPAHGWIKSGEDFAVKSNTGRDRLNINGALNAREVTDVVVRTDERIDSASTITLFKQIERRNRSGTIHVICDNARYYRSRAVQEWVKTSRIHLHFLPGYSPNLNLIERLWKYLRKKAIDTIYYPTREQFREGVMAFFRNIKEHREALESLLTLQFHIA
jgi:transposase